MRADHIHHRIDMQKSTRSLIKAAYENLVKVGRDRITSTRINTRIEAVRDYWHQFSTNDRAIKLALLQVDSQTREEIYKRSYFTHDHLKETNDLYLDVLEKMKDLLREHSSPSTVTASSSIQYKQSSSSANSTSYQTHRLPRIDLPKFNGTLTDWLSFKGLFMSMVYSNPSISAVEKLQYLKTSLVGPAGFLLKNTDLTENNFQRAWEAVLSFYENERRLVNAALKSLFALKKMTKDCSKELEHLYMSFGQVYRTLESLNRPIHQCDDFLVFMMIQRLDPESIKAWEIHLGSLKSTPTWLQLKEFIESRLLSLQSFESSQISLNQRNPCKVVTSSARLHFTSTSLSCPVCSSSHYLFQCEKFKAKTTDQRRDFVRSKGLCFNCLSGHKILNCKSTRRCQKCSKKHHSLLHFQTPKAPTLTNERVSEKQVHHVHSDLTSISVLLATMKIKIINKHGEQITIWALLDQGSEISLVSERLVQKLRLPRKQSSLFISGVGANKIGKTKGSVDLVVQSHFDDSVSMTIQANILPILTSILPSIQCSNLNSLHHLKNLQLADPEFNNRKQIDLIVGADYYGHLLEGSIIKGPIGSPVAQLTKFGWIISGPVTTNKPDKATSLHCSIDHGLNELMEKFWVQEELPIRKQSLSPEDEACETHFNSTHSRDSDGRYIVRLPFKLPKNLLGNSLLPAQQALRYQFSKFHRNKEYFNAYTLFMEEYKRLEHMVRAFNSIQSPKAGFYLPHHGVVRETSSTTKLRVVFNGSCRAPGGQPLNDILHTGSKLQTNLFDVLLRMRKYKYIFSADIEKMYRQIKVHSDDWDFQRILWEEQGETVEYQLTTVTYGLVCAPFLALRAVLQLIKDEGHKYPEAVNILTNDRYVDDIFGGADSLETAKVRVTQVNKLCMAGGFPLKKWVSNSQELLNQIPVEDRAFSTSLQLQDETVRALGLFWNPAIDQLFFKFAFTAPKTNTKRTVLSKIAQLFDPLGLLSPVFIKLKIFMQELWAVKLNWDKELPSLHNSSWNKLQDSLNGLETIQIPRWFGFSSNSSIELHGFCDASQLAMAAVVFIRSSREGVTVSHILCSKTKVAPLKRMTIPRLELSAAVILTKLIKHCLQALELHHAPCHLWTDSTVVLTWIRSHPSKWKEFVHNRVCIIQESLPSAQWHHIDGSTNPADCATRGLSSQELEKFSLWWSGPEWLTRDSTEWPSNEISVLVDQNLEERPNLTHHVTTNQPWDFLGRYSSWIKLTRITALCQRICSLLLKRKTPPLKSPLTPEELSIARQFLIRYTQKQYFHKEIQILTKKQELEKCNSLLRLCPFIDQRGLLRLGGRLNNAMLNENAKHPYILPRHSNVSALLIQHAHLKTLHGSTRDTLAYLRQEYWILGGRAPVRSFILKCVTCIRQRREHAQSLMGQLPTSRVTPSRPFLHSGVDYAGPFTLKTWQGKSRLYKAWIAVFVCFSTSAVHLEIVTDYTSDAFIASYKRFVSRRGICATLTSDCGTNFKGADRDLKKLFVQHSEFLGRIASLIASDGTKWHFNPPSAPHFGGKFEAAVKSMKYHLKRLIGDTNLTYEQLSTILAQIEAILNSRPLCALTDDPDDLNVLTPGHFLVGHALNLIPETDLQLISASRLSKWQHLSQMIQSFWSKWSKEYLQRHQAVYKWNKKAKPLAKGDLVLIIDERYPPCKWPLARITEVHPGPDNIVRVVTVKTSTSTFTRPIVKLSPLFISSSSDNSLPGAAKAGGNV